MNAVGDTAALFSGPVGEQLHRRLEEVAEQARELLGLAPPAAGESLGLDDVRALAHALSQQLRPDERSTAVIDEHGAALERLRARFEGRFEALARIQAAVGELRETTSPAVLCGASRLDRAILSLVAGGRMVAEAVHFAGEQRAAAGVLAELKANPVRLEHPLIETELLRRRRATIVVGADVHPRVDRHTARVMGWRAYVAAPLVVGTQVVGVIHGDRGADQGVDVLDRDVLWEFATGLAQAYESASLRRTLRDERDQMRQFLDWLRARSSELTDAPVTLTAGGQAPLAMPAAAPLTPPPVFGGPGRDDRVVFEGLLTRRELDVLRLLAEGASNRAVADALVISSGTVKFHVNSILRKLHAANRAEAVSRYLKLLGLPAP
jgi:LuxR family transcriptional regulator, regulator of acetate metabolism